MLIISLIVFILGVALSSYGVVVRSESIIIVSSVLILFPMPFLMLSYKGLRGEIRNPNLYGNAIVALITISIVSLLGYFLFATISGKAVSLAIFIGTLLSLVIEYINRLKERKDKGTVEDKQEPSVQDEMDVNRERGNEK